MKDRIEEIFQQVMNEACPDPLRRFAELVAEDALAQPESHTTLHDVCQEILRLEQANADMLSALRAIVAVAKTEDSFSMQTIKDCANIAIKQATGEQA